MILMPAVDILDGKAVRLARGEFDKSTVYDADPLDAARRWVSAGARALHIVDLDGAREHRAGRADHARA
jgi:phosphoribosylformimino-5-aminoimidazole carboxamide ribotide isomerase